MDYLIAMLRDESGEVTVETALLALLVSIASFAAYQALGGLTAGYADRANGALQGTN